ncbi:tyrosine-type recombinase/integrase [Halococcus saccharolyticus]|uniref:Integrase family protein n=1 Tax=Halococcus saccharolyticus DSM 5350 TaxID=1227455 RepID=M0MQK9_9EURY|nr:tyrosine-type recombinase/integrase [Halococcus saccharolyticus]EMA47926.1 integrase family protein [Halococcus saccharolyticus DSM 5350]
MPTDPATEIVNLRERIETGDEISDSDSEVLLRFSDELRLRGAEYSDHRHEKLLRHCTIMAEEVGGLADTLDDRETTKRIVRWINRTYDNEETNRDYRIAIRVFGKRVTESDEPPDSIDWVSGQTSRNYDPAPEPRDMLHWDDHILPMIEGSRNPRDAALIAVAWDSGARSGEIRGLTVGDITDHDNGLQITVEGKTGKRTVTLIPSVPHLQKWIDDHPAPDDRNAPLWCKLSSADELSFRMFKKALESAAERAGVDRPVTLTNFRKSCAAHLASRGMNQAHIEEHHGWTRGSRVASRYISVFSDDSDRELARIRGLDVSDEEPDPIGPVECPRCDRETPREQPTCVWCNQPLSQEGKQQLDMEERRVRRQFMKRAADNPEFLDILEDEVGMDEFFEDRQELRSEIERFARERAED